MILRLKVVKRVILASGLLVLLAGSLFYLRSRALHSALQRAEQFAERHDLKLRHSGLHWTGLSALAFEAITLTDAQGDTALFLHKPAFEADLFAALGGKLSLQAFSCTELRADWTLSAAKKGGNSARTRRLPALPAALHIGRADIRLRRAEGPDLLRLQGMQVDYHYSGEQLSLRYRADSARLQHPALAEGPVCPGVMELRVTARRGRVGWETGEGGFIRLNGARIGLRGGMQGDSLHLECTGAKRPAAAWLADLPRGLCPRLQGLSLDGDLGFRLSGYTHLRDRSRSDLRAESEADGFAVRSMPAVWAGYVRKPAPAVPAALREAVILAEDAGFRDHAGVNFPMLCRAFADNLRTGRFGRGGGTISMQLVRNTYLDPGKRLGRKVEELILALCLESHRKGDKDALLDEYLSLIEWGPGVYGAEAACRYYFGKEPAGLLPDECLFLAAVIPNPKAWRTLLDEKGRPGPFLLEFAEGMRYMMVMKGIWEESILDQPFQLPGLRDQAPASAASSQT